VFVGRPDNIDAAQMTYQFLCEQIEALYKHSLPKGLTQRERAKYRKEFKFTASLRVYNRACEIIRSMRAGEQIEGTGSTALVVVSQLKQLEAEVNDFLSQVVGGKEVKGRSVTIKEFTQGVADGRRAGDKVQLNKVVS
jgi:hypothetical protein